MISPLSNEGKVRTNDSTNSSHHTSSAFTRTKRAGEGIKPRTDCPPMTPRSLPGKQNSSDSSAGADVLLISARLISVTFWARKLLWLVIMQMISRILMSHIPVFGFYGQESSNSFLTCKWLIAEESRNVPQKLPEKLFHLYYLRYHLLSKRLCC